ncbi:mitogen-activated protein kinase kinase kinase 7-like isoform X1 [Ptychodera flava]|uniref:mitogen-activated protein kinase kinase kinase 7-like isoform X1 n=1 Tax=Ptychodera flava TaxID=63121 RepID=UPI00396A203F
MSTAGAATQFVEEVQYSDLLFEKVVGRGSFGVVSQAKWKDLTVAVKMIETEAEIKAFLVEVRQLSRVNHPNIVKVYGACTEKPVCLVMEYADGGSLYNVLHNNPPIPEYTAAHAMSWALQCAKGVTYLHGMKPKALIHRDLKPANLLLVAGGTILKICDFGTACDIQTYMTNNKGSAAWMAPEVFEGSYYSEKCDVFSWGIILWEVISRRKPFDEIGGPAFRIMWAVHNGTRPPLIKNIPKPLEILMTRCWAKEAGQRPSMEEVLRVMSNLMQFFHGADEPLVYPHEKENEESEYGTETESNLIDLTSPPNHSTAESRASTLSDTVIKKQPTQIAPSKYQTQPAGIIRRDSGRESGKGKHDPKRHSADLLEFMSQSQSQQTRPAIQTHRRCRSHGNVPRRAFPHGYSSTLPSSYRQKKHQRPGLTHAQSIPYINIHENSHPSSYTNPASFSFMPISSQNWYSGSNVQTHRRSNSHGNIPPQAYMNATTASTETSTTATTTTTTTGDSITTVATTSVNHMGRPKTDQSMLQSHSSTESLESNASAPGLSLTHAMTAPGSLVEQQAAANTIKPVRSLSWEPPAQTAEEYIPMAYLTLDHHLQPLPPCMSSPESMAVFDMHCKTAQEYLRVQTELALLHKRKRELANELDQDWKDQQNSSKILEEYTFLMEERESLLQIHKEMKAQLDLTRQQRRQGSVSKR